MTVRIPKYVISTVQSLDPNLESESLWGDHADHIVILVPGALREGSWANIWLEHLKKELYSENARSRSDNIMPYVLKHDIISVISVITGIGLLGLVKFKRSQINRIIKNNPDKTISVVCHSYGTYIMKDIMEFGLDRKLRSCILMGSILRRNDIEAFVKNSEIVVADGCQADYVALFLEAFFAWKFQNTSTFQFGGEYSNLVERRNPGGHGACTSLVHCIEFVIPAICAKQVVLLLDQPRVMMPDWSAKAVRYIAILFSIFVIIFVKNCNLF